MRIVSLLPSATEIVYALGLEDRLAGVSVDCDHPPEARAKPVVSRSSLEIDATASTAAIDSEVRARVSADEPIYRVDRALIRELNPDLILAQDLCRVCAVPSGHVTEALESLGSTAEVISLDPNTLEDVLDGIEEVARATSSSERGALLVADLRARLAAIEEVTRDVDPIPSFALEWADPPFTGGHWVPEMLRVAGGRDVLGVEGAPSRTCTWDEIAVAAPEVIVFMPCGYGLAEAIDQAAALFDVPQFARTPAARNGRVWAVDGSAYFSRPGPRLVDGVEILAWILHPDRAPAPPAGRAHHLTR